VEDAHTSKKDIVLCYLDFKGAFPSTDHKQLVRTLEFLGLPRDFTLYVSNLYSGASTQFITPHGHTPPVGIGIGTLLGDPLSPLLFDLMIEPLIRWLNASQKGYHITSCGLRLSSKWYADDATLIAHNVKDLNTQLEVVNVFSEWSGMGFHQFSQAVNLASTQPARGIPWTACYSGHTRSCGCYDVQGCMPFMPVGFGGIPATPCGDVRSNGFRGGLGLVRINFIAR
jgi:hypothetical protein